MVFKKPLNLIKKSFNQLNVKAQPFNLSPRHILTVEGRVDSPQYLREGSADDIKRQAIKDGMKTLRMCALTKVAQGLTTLDEAVMNSSTDKL